MAIILDGKKIAQQIEEEVLVQIVKKGLNPKLHVLIAGDDQASQIYIKEKEKHVIE